jgi:hypothetical protein
VPPDSKYTVLIGHFGSGKTELSLALARHYGREGGRTALVDLDIVNPYFRSSEHEALLTSEGIDVVSPSFAHTTVDVPALSADVHKVFDSPLYRHVIFDVGGDPAGATALGRYEPFIRPVRDQMRVCYVVNPLRPLTATEDAICALLSRMEARARVRADMLVNNANLQRETTAKHLVQAQELLERVSKRLHIPVGMVAGYGRLKAGLPETMREIFFPIEPMMLPEWLEDDRA